MLEYYSRDYCGERNLTVDEGTLRLQLRLAVTAVLKSIRESLLSRGQT